MTEFTSNMEAITQILGPLEGKSILDIGCGRGRLSRALSKRGAEVTGIDPQETMLQLAREAVPDGTFERAGAERLPFANAGYDGAVILNSLHHIPEDAIDAALSEAIRVLKPGAMFLILEPLARGGYHEVFAPIDDETEIRAVALAKLEAFISRTGVKVMLRTEFETMVPEESVESVLAGAVRVDPTRKALVEEKRDAVAQLYAAHVTQTERGPALDQPMIAIALAASQSA